MTAKRTILILGFLLCLAFPSSAGMVIGGAAPPQNLDCYGTAADGYILASSSNWSTVRNASTGAMTSNTTTDVLGLTWNFTGTYFIDRGFLYIDTSGLPDTCTITAAVLHIYVTQVDGSAQCTIYEGTQQDTLANEDYNNFNAAWSSATSLTASQYNDITLTTLTGISKTGVTKLCIRESTYDVAGATPSAGPYDFYIRYADYTGTSSDPYMTVTYTP